VTSLALINIGRIISGDLDRGLLEADTVLIEDGLVTQIGDRAEIDAAAADVRVDVKGAALAPGLIDTHVHIVLGDWTPRQNALGFIESYMHGGVTGMMSASEVHLPGVPQDPVGVKALAITAHKAYVRFRPGGVKVYAGSVIFQPGLTEQDFKEMSEAGVWLGKVGFDAVYGARPLKRAIQNHLETPLARAILSGTFGPGQQIRVSLRDNTLGFSVTD